MICTDWEKRAMTLQGWWMAFAWEELGKDSWGEVALTESRKMNRIVACWSEGHSRKAGGWKWKGHREREAENICDKQKQSNLAEAPRLWWGLWKGGSLPHWAAPGFSEPWTGLFSRQRNSLSWFSALKKTTMIKAMPWDVYSICIA